MHEFVSDRIYSDGKELFTNQYFTDPSIVREEIEDDLAQ